MVADRRTKLLTAGALAWTFAWALAGALATGGASAADQGQVPAACRAPAPSAAMHPAGSPVEQLPARDVRAGRTTSVTGWLGVLWSDARDGSAVDPGPSYTLTDERGRAYAVHPDPTGAGPTPWWRLGGSRVTVRGTIAAANPPGTDGAAARPVRPTILAARLAPGAVALSAQAVGEQHWLTVLCRFSDLPDEPHAPEWYLDRYGSAHPRLGHFWAELSFGQLELDGVVRGWYGLPGPLSTYVLDVDGDGELDALDEARAARDCTAAADGDVHYPDYDGIQLAFNHPLALYARGGTHFLTLDGESRAWRMTWLPDWAYDNLGVVEHEMGHALGLPHSVATWPTIYDNVWDLMSDVGGAVQPGFGVLGQHTIAFHKDLLGWVGAGATYVAGWGSNATVWLDRLSQPPGLAHLLARIPIQGARTHFYTVEARQLVGYDSALPASAVILHEVDTLRNEPARIVDTDADGDTTDEEARWLVGETFVDAESGITVSVVAASPDGFQVTIAVRPEPAFAGCAAQTQIPAAECQALVDLYLTASGPSWTTAAGWLSSGAPCSWFGVSCSAGHVARLELPQNRLAGTLPPSLGQLTSLRRLDLQRNALVGSIPGSLADLTQLQLLYLNENDLEGPIPPGLGDLYALQVLLLYDNRLTGAIPGSLGALTVLQYLYLDANRLEGVIPAQLGGLVRLRALGLRGNQLGSDVPAALADLDDLATLELDYNLFTASDAAALELMARLEPDWRLTQTVAPTQLAAAAASESAVALSWVPISYTANAGFYEIAYATSPGGPYTVHGTTADKSASNYLADGLAPATNYWWVVRTFSAAIGYQQNDLWSPRTAEVVAGTTGAPPTATPSPTTTLGPSPTPSATPSDTASPTATTTSEATAIATPTATFTPTVTATATPTDDPDPTATAQSTATATPEPTPEPTPTEAATADPTATATDLASATPSPTATATELPSATPSEPASAEPSPLPTETWLPTASEPPTATDRPAATPTPRQPATRAYLPWLARAAALPVRAPAAWLEPQPSTGSSLPGGSGKGS